MILYDIAHDDVGYLPGYLYFNFIFVVNTFPWTNPTPLTTNLQSLSLYTWLWLKILGPPKWTWQYYQIWSILRCLWYSIFDPQLHSYTHICVYIILYIILSYIIFYYIIYLYIYMSILYTYNFCFGNRTLSTIPAQPWPTLQLETTSPQPVLLATLFSNVCTPLGPGYQSLAGEFSQDNVHEIARVFDHLSQNIHVNGKIYTPGDSKWPFYPLVGGHLTFERVHLTIPKRSLWITRLQYVYYTLKGIWTSNSKVDHLVLFFCDPFSTWKNAPKSLTPQTLGLRTRSFGSRTREAKELTKSAWSDIFCKSCMYIYI